MSQPRKWLPGLVVIAALAGIAALTQQGGMERALQTDGNASLQQAGLSWAKVALDGRDAVVSGEAPEPGLPGLALAAAERAFGIRQVRDDTRVLPLAEPFVVRAERSGQRVSLSGNVPPEAARQAWLANAKKALPGVDIQEAWQPARGAPADMGGQLGFGLAQLARLSEGRLELGGAKLSITGRALDSASFAAIRGALAALPAGLSLGKGLGEGDILPPIAKPFSVKIDKSAAGIVLSGHVPSLAARARWLAAAKPANGTLTDRLELADGAPGNLEPAIAFAMAQVPRLENGSVNLVESRLSVTGRAASPTAYAEIRAQLAALPTGLALERGLGEGDILPAIVAPFGLSAEKSAAGLALSGYIPAEAMRAGLLAAAQRAGGPIRDGVQIAGGAPSGDWAGATQAGLGALGKLASGKVSLIGTKLAIAGTGLPNVTNETIRADLRALPAGFSLESVAIELAAIKPYLLEAQRGEGQLALSGHLPDAKARAELLEHARGFFEGERIEDGLAIGPGAPKDFLKAAKSALEDLARLAPGASLRISDQAIALRGATLFEAAKDQLGVKFRRQLPEGFSGTADLAVAPIGPPIAEPAECQTRFVTALTSAKIRFSTGSAEISDTSAGLLDRLALVALRCQEVRIEVAGHTDSDGSAETNAELSRRRAEAVAKYFVAAGIAAERLQAVGYGASNPVAPNDSPDNKAKNRRIELNVK